MSAIPRPLALGVIAALALITVVPLAANAAQSARDSAGIRIVENAAPLLRGARAPHLARAPWLELDPTTGADYAFGGVDGVIRLDDARIIVAARTSPQFRLFDARGRLLHAIDERRPIDRGNRDRHTIAKLRGDTIAVLHNSDVLLFVVAGDSLRQISAPPELPQGPPGELRLNVLASGGSAYVTFPRPAAHAVGTQWEDSTGFVLRERDGALITELGRVPYVTLAMTSTGMTSVWLSATAVTCAGSGRFVFGFGDAYTLRVYSERGALESIVRRAWSPTPVTAADWEHWVVDWSKLWITERGADSLKAVQRVREELYAFALPAFAGCLVASDGSLWVREAHLDDAISAGSLSDDPIVPSTWSVFDAAGRWITDVTMPAGFQPTDVGSDYVAGRFRRGPGRTTVVMYQFAANAR